MSQYRAILFLALVMAGSPGMASTMETPMSTSLLYAACKESPKSDYSLGYCEGAIDAIYSSMKNWCVPQEVTHGEVKKQILKVLLAEGASSSKRASEFVEMAVHRKWPCQE